MTIGKRVSRLEIKSADSIGAMAEAERNKKIEARNKWREDNHVRIRWHMFLELFGPDSDWYKTPDVSQPCVIGEIAYAEMFRKVLAEHYDDHIVNYGKMKGLEVPAFVQAIEMFFEQIDDYDLLTSYLAYISGDLPARTPLEDVAALKIAKDGLEWLQIAWNDEMQLRLENHAFGEWISKDFSPN